MNHVMPGRVSSLLTPPALLVLLLLASCSNCGDCGVTAPAALAAPKVVGSTPACSATCIAPDQDISVVFSQPMDPATINTTTVRVTGPGGAPVAGTVTYSGVTATFDPTEPLAGGTSFHITVSSGAHDAAGNPLSPEFDCEFTTTLSLDTTAPLVNNTEPVCGSTGAAPNRSIAVTFSEAMNPATIDGTTLRLSGPGGALAGTVTYSGLTGQFNPAAPLAAGTTFALTVTTGARDTAGNPLATNFLCGFTTGAAPDTTAPTVSFLDPLCGTTGVAIDTAVVITFSETMDPATITAATVSLTGQGGPLAGVVSYVGRTATFTPEAPLAPSSTFTVGVGVGAEDLAGNAMAAPFSCSFQTGLAPDVAAPSVVTSIPACAATGVPPNHALAVRFSEAMNPETVTTATFTVTGPDCAVAGTVICDSCVNATFTPVAPFTAATPFQMRISNAATDLAGNPLAAEFLCGFTTGTARDTVSPTVATTTPASGADGVCPSQQIRATFSEIMDPVTLSTETFVVTGPGATPVAGFVAYDLANLVAIFTPNSALPADTTITVRLNGGAHDLAGLPLVAGAVPNPWTFATGALPCAEQRARKGATASTEK
ncbi:MAG TPA: Ig-like domain-containing protein [Solimonas sp.]|nr:Ig-like domain-containing protein [Solimonas sp.]